MVKVLLINQDKIPHYRVPVYNYLSEYLGRRDIALTVVSCGAQDGNPHEIRFDHRVLPLSFVNLAKLLLKLNPDTVIFWVNLKYLYLFPVLMLTKIMRKKSIYWGHGRDLADEKARIKNIAYALEQGICDAIILYAEHLNRYVLPQYHSKVFVANNTLNMTEYRTGSISKERIRAKYGIKTDKNIICMGRLQKRKRLGDLFKAFEMIDNGQFGLILVGPDADGILRNFVNDNVYKLGPVYGNDALDLLSASDVCCIPGAVGLSIVDAFYSSLPLVTMEGERSPEIMYLKDGNNGFVVKKGDVKQLAARLKELLENDTLRTEFSRAARNEIMLNGHIDVMCKGFYDAIQFVHSNR